jgi:hypothetical protein
VSRLPWSSVAVRLAARGSQPMGRDITGTDRLAMLYLWHRDGHPPASAVGQVSFINPTSGKALDAPREVDWTGFPWGEAVKAVLAPSSRR